MRKYRRIRESMDLVHELLANASSSEKAKLAKMIIDDANKYAMPDALSNSELGLAADLCDYDVFVRQLDRIGVRPQRTRYGSHMFCFYADVNLEDRDTKWDSVLDDDECRQLWDYYCNFDSDIWIRDLDSVSKYTDGEPKFVDDNYISVELDGKYLEVESAENNPDRFLERYFNSNESDLDAYFDDSYDFQKNPPRTITELYEQFADYHSHVGYGSVLVYFLIQDDLIRFSKKTIDVLIKISAKIEDTGDYLRSEEYAREWLESR